MQGTPPPPAEFPKSATARAVGRALTSMRLSFGVRARRLERARASAHASLRSDDGRTGIGGRR